MTPVEFALVAALCTIALVTVVGLAFDDRDRYWPPSPLRITSTLTLGIAGAVLVGVSFIGWPT